MTSSGEDQQAEMAADASMRKEVELTASDRVVAQEKALIAGDAEKAKARRWCGIALSGGGIRSSTFCTGILQSLANEDRLKSFDYISTVSGGGFIGCSLRWWWHGTHGVKNQDGKDVEFGTGPEDFPYGTSDPRDPNSKDTEEQKTNLGYLRDHGNYLTPGNGITLWSGLAVVIRTILLNLLVWIPIAVGLFYLSWWIRADWWGLSSLFSILPNGGSPLPEAVICPRWIIDGAGHVIDHVRINAENAACTSGQPQGFTNVLALPPFAAIMIWGSFFYLGFYAVGSLFFSIQTSRTHGAGGAKFTVDHWKWVGVAIALSAVSLAVIGLLPLSEPDWFWVQAAAFVALFVAFAILARMFLVWARNWYYEGRQQQAPDKDFSDLKDMSQAYFLRRFFERTVSAYFKVLLILLILGFIPVVFKLIFSASATAGFLSLAIGVAAALTAHAQKFRAVAPGLIEKLLLPVGAGLLLFGVVVLGYQIAMMLLEIDLLATSIDAGMKTSGEISPGAAFEIETSSFSQAIFDQLGGQTGPVLRLLIAFLVVLAFVMAIQVNTNQISLNRFYRDRLMETFLPHARAVKSGEVGPTPADALELHELWQDRPEGSGEKKIHGPYPLINTNCVLVNDDVHKVSLRGGDNYLLSPLYCGSAATGWSETKNPACKMLTLPTAMATSGAAANPNSGFVGTGATRGCLISLVMMLLNIRLGLWVLNPSKNWKKDVLRRPTHIRPSGHYALSNSGFKRSSSFLELSDGGHFDNSGLYELIRRRCEVILACDGEADKDFSFAGFVSLQRRVAEDFGVAFKFYEDRARNYWPKETIPSKALAYPKGALCAELPFFAARIIYPKTRGEQEPKEGKLIYIKSTMIDDLSFTTKGYKAKNPDFPHETTADQFFDPEQFEVYRELGYYAAKLMMDHVDEDWNLRAKPRSRKMDIEALAEMPDGQARPTTRKSKKGD